MFKITAPTKFVLTLHPVPPFLFEIFLVLVLVIILSLPLISRIKSLVVSIN